MDLQLNRVIRPNDTDGQSVINVKGTLKKYRPAIHSPVICYTLFIRKRHKPIPFPILREAT